MSKVKKNDSSKIYETIILIIGLVLITVLCTILLINVIKDRNYTKLSQIEHITLSEYDQMGSEGHEEYYVLFYASETNEFYTIDTYRTEYVREVVLNYANYARKHDDAPMIYLVDLSKEENQFYVDASGNETAYETKLSITYEDYVPYLLNIENHIEEGHTHTLGTYKDVDTIINELNSAMEE